MISIIIINIIIFITVNILFWLKGSVDDDSFIIDNSVKDIINYIATILPGGDTILNNWQRIDERSCSILKKSWDNNKNKHNNLK